MPRLATRLLWVLLGLGAALASARGVATAKEEAPAEPPGSGARVAWIDDYEAALATAQEGGRMVLLYLALDPKTCPPCRRLERRVFAADGAEAIQERVVPLKLMPHVPGRARDAELARRLHVRVFPTLLVLSPTGDVVYRQMHGLYPAYSLRHRPLPGSWGPEITLDALLEALTAAEASWRADREQLQALSVGEQDTPSLERAEILARWNRVAEAVTEIDRVLGGTNTPAQRARAARALVAARAFERAEQVFTELASTNPKDPLALHWHVEAVLARVTRWTEGPEDTRPEIDVVRIRELLRRITAARNLPEELRLRAALAAYARHAQKMELVTEADRARLFALHAEAEAEPDADSLLRIVMFARAGGWADHALAAAELLMRAHPESFGAQVLKHGELDILRRMARQMKRDRAGPK